MSVKRYKKERYLGNRDIWRPVASLIKSIQKSEVGRTQEQLWDDVKIRYGCEFDTFKDYLKPRRQPPGLDRFFSAVAEAFAKWWPEVSARPAKEKEYLSRLYAALRMDNVELATREKQGSIETQVDSLSAVRLHKIDETHSQVNEILAMLLPRMEEVKRQGITEASLRAIANKIEAQMSEAPIEDILQTIESFVIAAIHEGKVRSSGSNEARDLLALRTAARVYLDAGELENMSLPFDEALERRRSARARRLAEETAEDARLFEEAADYDRLVFNIDKAVDRYSKVAELLEPDDEGRRIRYLSRKADELHLLGQSRGDRSALLIAIRLGRKIISTIDHKMSSVRWGILNNALASMLCDLGEQEVGVARLKEAAAVCAETLKILRRKNTPLEWAATQNTLGHVFSCLGERDEIGKYYMVAIVCFRNALKEYPREREPVDWGITQFNLGNVLVELGHRSRNSKRLKQGILHLRKSLEVRPRDTMPLQWAVTSGHIGGALFYLGVLEGREKLQESVIACREALDLIPDTRIEWAGIQNSLGSALTNLAELGANRVLIEDAITAFRRALAHAPIEHVPRLRSLLQENLERAEKVRTDLVRKRQT